MQARCELVFELQGGETHCLYIGTMRCQSAGEAASVPSKDIMVGFSASSGLNSRECRGASLLPVPSWMGAPRLSVVPVVVIVSPVYTASLLGRPTNQSRRLRLPDGFEFRGCTAVDTQSACGRALHEVIDKAAAFVRLTHNSWGFLNSVFQPASYL